MQALLLLVVCISALSAVNCAKYVGSESMYYELELAEEIFAEFIEYYGHNYDVNEYEQRLEIFKHNLETINRNNERDNAPNFGLTQFTAMSSEELRTGLNTNYENFEFDSLDMSGFDEKVPDAFDWRGQNVLTPVKNQGACESCWAFSTTATLESQYARKYKKLISLSEQQLNDCYTKNCQTGASTIVEGLKFVTETGIMSEKDYPYIGKDQHCNLKKDKIVLRDINIKFGQNLTIDEMQQLLVHYGPFSVAMFTPDEFFWFKGKGIFEDKPSHCPKDLEITHAINLVGYGTENGTDYWIMRNSWGTNWGDQGYAKILQKPFFCNIGREVGTAEVVSV